MTYDEILNDTAKLYPVNRVARGFRYYKRLLLEKCYDMYIYNGLPESLPAAQIESRLIMQGFCVIFEHPTAGLVCSYGGLSGVDKYYLPTDFVYAQPALGSGNLKIHKDCVVIWNSQIDQYERGGLYELVNRYARMLSDLDSSIAIMTVNYRSTFNHVVASDQVARTVDEAMKKIEAGERYTINQKSIIDMYKTVPWSDDKSGKIQELIDAKEQVLGAFLSEIGVKTSKNKREREITDEVAADNQLLTINVEDLEKWRIIGMKEVNNLFGTDITVSRNPDYEAQKEGDNNAII